MNTWQDDVRAYLRAMRIGDRPVVAIHVKRHWCTLARTCKVSGETLLFDGVKVIPTVESDHCGPGGLKR